MPHRSSNASATSQSTLMGCSPAAQACAPPSPAGLHRSYVRVQTVPTPGHRASAIRPPTTATRWRENNRAASVGDNLDRRCGRQHRQEVGRSADEEESRHQGCCIVAVVATSKFNSERGTHLATGGCRRDFRRDVGDGRVHDGVTADDVLRRVAPPPPDVAPAGVPKRTAAAATARPTSAATAYATPAAVPQPAWTPHGGRGARGTSLPTSPPSTWCGLRWPRRWRRTARGRRRRMVGAIAGGLFVSAASGDDVNAAARAAVLQASAATAFSAREASPPLPGTGAGIRVPASSS